MDKKIQTMIEKAHETMQYAYAPYSNFKVGCCILADDGHFYAGCNIENVIYMAQHAEAVALSNMIAHGGKKIKAAAILNGNNTICPPCGACRQLFSEFADKDTVIYLCNKDSILEKYKLDELLPLNFNKQTMEK